jgi:hypothetical protein
VGIDPASERIGPVRERARIARLRVDRRQREPVMVDLLGARRRKIDVRGLALVRGRQRAANHQITLGDRLPPVDLPSRKIFEPPRVRPGGVRGRFQPNLGPTLEKAATRQPGTGRRDQGLDSVGHVPGDDRDGAQLGVVEGPRRRGVGRKGRKGTFLIVGRR